MELIDQWLENNYIETGNYTDLEKEQFINSVSEIQDYMDSYIDESSSGEEDEDIDFQTYDHNPNKKTSAIPLNDSSAILNFDSPKNKSTFGLVKKNSRYITLEGNQLIKKLTNLDLKEDKENGGGAEDNANSTSYYQTARLSKHKAVPKNKVSIDRTLFTTNEDKSINCDICKLRNDNFEHHKAHISEDDLVLDEMPIFKTKARHVSNESLIITPDLLNSSDGETTYYEDISLIQDQTFLPRHFQHHMLKKSSLRNINEPYEYFKNKNCPPSASTDIALNYCHHRYTRISKLHKAPFKQSQFEVLCRFCRGKNWINKSEYIQHLIFSHGIVTIDYIIPPMFLPIPKSMFIEKNRSFKTFYVNCPSCSRWIRLGNSIYDIETEQQPKTQGLYYNFFEHYLAYHEEMSFHKGY